MSQSARVESVDALKEFRVALIKFADAANGALGDAESEVQRTQMWLENDQLMHWQSQIRKRMEVVSRAKEQLRMKKVFKDSTGSKASYVDEEKALAKATRMLEEAEQKLAATKSWARRFQKEAAAFKGAVQRMSTFVLADVPVATAKLDRMTAALQAYIAFKGPDLSGISVASSSGTAGAPAPAEPPALVVPEGHMAPEGAAEAEAPVDPAARETATAEGANAESQDVAEEPKELAPGEPAASLGAANQ
jgi:hypothetical protein